MKKIYITLALALWTFMFFVWAPLHPPPLPGGDDPAAMKEVVGFLIILIDSHPSESEFATAAANCRVEATEQGLSDKEVFLAPFRSEKIKDLLPAQLAHVRVFQFLVQKGNLRQSVDYGCDWVINVYQPIKEEQTKNAPSRLS